jgi:hypothetical protein
MKACPCACTWLWPLVGIFGSQSLSIGKKITKANAVRLMVMSATWKRWRWAVVGLMYGLEKLNMSESSDAIRYLLKKPVVALWA